MTHSGYIGNPKSRERIEVSDNARLDLPDGLSEIIQYLSEWNASLVAQGCTDIQFDTDWDYYSFTLWFKRLENDDEFKQRQAKIDREEQEKQRRRETQQRKEEDVKACKKEERYQHYLKLREEFGNEG